MALTIIISPLPGDSIRDLFISNCGRSPTTCEFGAQSYSKRLTSYKSFSRKPQPKSSKSSFATIAFWSFGVDFLNHISPNSSLFQKSTTTKISEKNRRILHFYIVQALEAKIMEMTFLVQLLTLGVVVTLVSLS